MPHLAPLDAHASRIGTAGKALDILLNQACLYLAARGDRAGALGLAERMVELMRSTRTDEPLILATGLNNLAGRYSDLNRLDEAETAHRKALAIREPRVDPNDQALAILLSNLGAVLVKRKQFSEAEPLFQRAANIIKTSCGEISAQYGSSLTNLDVLYDEWAEHSGDIDKRRTAERYSTQALTVTRATRGTRDPGTASRHNNLAVFKARLGDWQGAAADMERAVAIMLSLDLAQHPNTQRRARDLASCWRQSGQVDKAARLAAGDIPDIQPVLAQIEAEHRTWVAEDPEQRQFGPPSPFEKK
jgi:tetratricopeptide (TPR) repeat protein